METSNVFFGSKEDCDYYMNLQKRAVEMTPEEDAITTNLIERAEKTIKYNKLKIAYVRLMLDREIGYSTKECNIISDYLRYIHPINKTAPLDLEFSLDAANIISAVRYLRS